MIKFILLALLCFSFSDEIFGKFQEDKVGIDGYRLEAVFDDDGCCKDKNAKNASPEEPTICLNSKNSKKISDAVLNVLHKADSSYESIIALRIPEFMVSKITYQEWAENIQRLKLNFEGFAKLQKLVAKYVLCKKVCKVFFFLRESLREHASLNIKLDEYEEDNNIIVVHGDLIVLSDVRKDIELNFQKDPKYTGVRFSAESMIIDGNLLDNNGWAGKSIVIDVDNVIVPKKVSWSVEGSPGSYSNLFILLILSLTR
jgi:hypothetical protein